MPSSRIAKGPGSKYSLAKRILVTKADLETRFLLEDLTYPTNGQGVEEAPDEEPKAIFPFRYGEGLPFEPQGVDREFRSSISYMELPKDPFKGFQGFVDESDRVKSVSINHPHDELATRWRLDLPQYQICNKTRVALEAEGFEIRECDDWRGGWTIGGYADTVYIEMF